MAVTLKLEAIGCHARLRVPGWASMNYRTQKKHPWVAEIQGICDTYGFRRDFLSPLGDYSEANKVRSRGVYFYFHLFPGKIYEVYEHQSWKNDRRYFCTVEGFEVKILTKEEVLKWLTSDH